MDELSDQQENGYRLYVTVNDPSIKDYDTGFRSEEAMTKFISFLKREMTGIDYSLRIERN
jgi:hypothetical protein